MYFFCCSIIYGLCATHISRRILWPYTRFRWRFVLRCFIGSDFHIHTFFIYIYNSTEKVVTRLKWYRNGGLAPDN